MPRCYIEDASFGTQLEKASHQTLHGAASLWLLAHPAQLQGYEPQPAGREKGGVRGPCSLSTTWKVLGGFHQTFILWPRTRMQLLIS